MILVVFFGLDILINTLLSSFAIDFKVSTPKFWAGALGLGLIFGVYASEVFKGAYYAVPKGTLEASHALGLSKFQTTTQIHIPLMWSHALPGLMNLWLVLLKDTSLVAVIAFDELFKNSKGCRGNRARTVYFFPSSWCLVFIDDLGK